MHNTQSSTLRSEPDPGSIVILDASIDTPVSTAAPLLLTQVVFLYVVAEGVSQTGGVVQVTFSQSCLDLSVTSIMQGLMQCCVVAVLQEQHECMQLLPLAFRVPQLPWLPNH
jgi:hypothetical protein